MADSALAAAAAGLAKAGARLLRGELRQVRPLAGGDLSAVVRIELADGRLAVVKGGPAPRAEADMLTAIAATGAHAPRVLAVGDDALVLELADAGGSLHRAWPQVGAELRALHAATGPGYGWDCDYAFGAVAIENAWSADWPAFWAQRRLLVHVPHLRPPLARRVERLAAQIADRLPARPRPALLHGDLWGGNVIAAVDGGVSLVDPACYYGHTEVDLAMLTLFDTPSPSFYAAYGDLEPGVETRLAVYCLWPALVHVRLFGRGYESLLERLLATARA